jgi:hypothetical protein
MSSYLAVLILALIDSQVVFVESSRLSVGHQARYRKAGRAKSGFKLIQQLSGIFEESDNGPSWLG